MRRRRRSAIASQKNCPGFFRTRGHCFVLVIIIRLFGCFCIPRRYRIIRITHAAAHIHEAAASGIVESASAAGMIRESRARGNESTDDYVLLQAAQIVLETPDRSLGEHAGGLLEGGRRDERLGRQRGLGDPKQ